MHTSKDSMWQLLCKNFWLFLGTKHGLNNSDHKCQCGRRAGRRPKCRPTNETRSRERLDNDGLRATADSGGQREWSRRAAMQDAWIVMKMIRWTVERWRLEVYGGAASIRIGLLASPSLATWAACPRGPDARSRPASHSLALGARTASALKYAEDECFFFFIYIKYVYIRAYLQNRRVCWCIPGIPCSSATAWLCWPPPGDEDKHRLNSTITECLRGCLVHELNFSSHHIKLLGTCMKY
jgi:hypothetical protein